MRYGHPYEARDDLEAAVRLNSSLPNIYTLLGQACDTTGADHDAELAFRHALQINPDDLAANLGLGTVLYRRRALNEATTYLEHALQLKPGDPNAEYLVAMLKSVSGQYEAAVHDLEQVAKQSPDWPAPHIELAKLYYRLHRPEDGLRERKLADEVTARQERQKSEPQPGR